MIQNPQEYILIYILIFVEIFMERIEVLLINIFVEIEYTLIQH
jgi:hypothetical protein